MSLDPVTFVAQIINLAILIFLLYKLLYRPLLNAIDARNAQVASDIKRARDGVAEAERRLAAVAQKEKEIDAEKNAILEQAYHDADALRERLKNDARDEAAAKRASWMEELAVERTNLENELRTMIVDNFAAFSKKALTDLADTGLEARMTAVLADKYDALPDNEKAKLTGGRTAEIYTAFVPSEDTKKALTMFLNEKAGISAENIVFKEKPSLLCGMEIVTNGNVLSWNLDAYLDAFSQKMADALKAMATRVKNKEN